MSPKALVYSTEPLKHWMLVVREAEGVKDSFAEYSLRSLLSEGCIKYQTVKNGNPVSLEKEGPTGLLMTTTATHIHSENETRVLSIGVGDSPQLTRQIMQAQARHQASQAPLTPDWHALQLWLACRPNVVLVPFANVLADLVDARAVRLRRDFPTILSLIGAHALLHQATRQRASDGAVVATIDDYAAVRKLVRTIIAEGVEATVSATVRSTVDAVRTLSHSNRSVSLPDLAEELHIDKSAVSRRVQRARELGYLRNAEARNGVSARIVLGEPMPEDVEILPKASAVAARLTVADQEGKHNQ